MISRSQNALPALLLTSCIFLFYFPPVISIELQTCGVFPLHPLYADPDFEYQKATNISLVFPHKGENNPPLGVSSHPLVGLPILGDKVTC